MTTTDKRQCTERPLVSYFTDVTLAALQHEAPAVLAVTVDVISAGLRGRLIGLGFGLQQWLPLLTPKKRSHIMDINDNL